MSVLEGSCELNSKSTGYKVRLFQSLNVALRFKKTPGRQWSLQKLLPITVRCKNTAWWDGSCEYRKDEVTIVLHGVLIGVPFLLSYESICSSSSLFFCCTLTSSSSRTFRHIKGFSTLLSCWCFLELIPAWINIVWKLLYFLYCLESDCCLFELRKLFVLFSASL